MEPEEVADAFSTLQAAGKVRQFGLSNVNPGQIELLQKYVDQKLVADQLQLSLTNTGMIDSGLNVNMSVDNGINRDGGILEYCRLHEITIQPWSPFQFGFFEGVFLDNNQFPDLNEAIDALAGVKGVANTGSRHRLAVAPSGQNAAHCGHDQSTALTRYLSGQRR